MGYWKLCIPAAVACLACCATLSAPLFTASTLTGLGLSGYSESIELAFIFLGLGLVGLYLYQRKKRAAKACNCAADSGCHTDNAYHTP